MSNENTVTNWNKDIHSKEFGVDTSVASAVDIENFNKLEITYNKLLEDMTDLVNKQSNLVSFKGMYDRIAVIDMLKRCKIN